MKPLLLTAALLLLVPQTQAGPLVKAKNWVHRHPKAVRVTVKVALATTAAVVHANGLRNCREGSFENCDGGYGGAWAIFGAYTATNFLLIPLSEKIGGIEGDVLSYGGSGFQLGHGIYEGRKEVPHAKNVDLSGVVIVHR